MRRHRDSKGSMLAEAAISMLIMLPCLAIALNAAFALMVYENVDWACRDAARAAAQAITSPASPVAPEVLAQHAADTALAAHQLPGMTLTAKVVSYDYVVADKVSSVSSVDTNNFYLCDARSGAILPEHEGPSVTVVTSTSYRLPFPMIGFGRGPSSSTAPVQLSQKYTFPILIPTIWMPEE